jgi:hypothetical protein
MAAAGFQAGDVAHASACSGELQFAVFFFAEPRPAFFNILNLGCSRLF